MRDIYVYGGIGDRWDPDGVTAKQFVDELREAAGDEVSVHVNSGGGDVFDANTMAEAIRSYQGRTVAVIEGIAASAASYFALTADEVRMSENALFMIHNPSTFAWGDAEEMRKAADSLEKVKATIVNQYVRKTGKDAAEVSDLMDAETWLTAEEALDGGFVDELLDAEPVAAMVTARDMAAYKAAPSGLVPASGPAGEPQKNISPKDDRKAGEGASRAGEGASPDVVCVHGTFLRARREK